MSLLFSKTRDQALLAFVIKEASERAQSSGTFVGRTALQKMLYFLNIQGVKMAYRFSIYYYGPFSENILRDVDWLMADGVLEDKSSDPNRYSNYSPGPAIDELISMHEESIESDRQTIQTVVSALIKLKPDQLELMATLDYIYRQQHASGAAGPFKERVISRFREVKREKFPQSEIETVYHMMVRAGLVKA